MHQIDTPKNTRPVNLLLIKSDALLLITSVIWGFAFVAQRMGMDHVGPFTFNGVRFALGSLVLLPLILRDRLLPHRVVNIDLSPDFKTIVLSGSLAGIALFSGASLQQVGLVYTTAGNAGFITGLYVVIVPILGLFWGHQPRFGTWMGAGLAAIGLYFLSINEGFTISFGDFLELLGAFFWAGHVLILGWLSPKMESIKLAFFQYVVCSFLSLATAAIWEVITVYGILQAAVPILYGGICSVGVAYTLQVVAQRNAHPAHAAILLSLEAVFAAIGGWLVLDETLSVRGLFGCAMMLAGMLLSQLWTLLSPHSAHRGPEPENPYP